MPADKLLGQKGEAIAARYYMQQGYLLLAHGYRTRMGELDLVLYHNGTVIFAEVKTRSGTQKVTPAEAVNIAKQRRIILAAQKFLQNSSYADCPVRFDVVEVWPPDAKNRRWKIHCIRSAFSL